EANASSEVFLMKRHLGRLGIALAAFLLAGASYTLTNEVAVSHTFPTQIPRTPGYTGWEIDNNGPNSEDCAVGADLTDAGPPVYVDGGFVLGSANSVSTGHAHSIAAGGSWSGTSASGKQIWCLAATADQTAGAATVITESP